VTAVARCEFHLDHILFKKGFKGVVIQVWSVGSCVRVCVCVCSPWCCR